MNELINRKEVSEMVRISISDISTCLEDIENFESDFQKRYMKDINYEGLSNSDKKILTKVKNDVYLFRKRTLIKTVFSNIDGIIYATKQLLLEDRDKIDDDDIIRLQEKKYEGPSHNRLKEIPVFSKNFIENIKLTFKCYKKYRFPNYNLDNFYTELDKYKIVKEIRNKVTHPKHSSDLNVSDDELEKCRVFDTWFFKEYRRLIELEL